MKPTRLYLVRHGATTATAEERFSGATGVELSAEGRRQAEALAGRLRDDGIEAVYSSPYGRSLDTARILAGPLGKVPIPCDGLREISHGHWEGLTRREVEHRFPEEYAAYEADPFTSAPRGGESGVEVMARSLPVLRDVVLAHPGARALLVSHKATLRLLLSSLLGFDPRGYRNRLDQAPACLNVVDFRDPVRARLMLFNDVSHYAALPRQPGANLSGWWDPPGDPY
ncbi:MAG TPA: histidine phosphatase family protein [Gemmatimonadales bacterium]|nr:histidine phosphatase family protein [Gemmatimonadales bacterium]